MSRGDITSRDMCSVDNPHIKPPPYGITKFNVLLAFSPFVLLMQISGFHLYHTDKFCHISMELSPLIATTGRLLHLNVN